MTRSAHHDLARRSEWPSLQGRSSESSSFVRPNDDRLGLLLVVVVAAFVGWLDWRAGASRRQIIFSILLAVAAVVVSRVITFVILFQWAFG